MRKLLMVLMLFCAAGKAFALNTMGPPAATIDKGQFAAGLGYCWSKVDMEVSALGFTTTVEDQGIETFLANLVFGLHENWELQIDLGASDTEFEQGSQATDFTGGFILRTTFGKKGEVKWGGTSSVHWYKIQGGGVYDGIPWTEEDCWSEIQFSVGPTWERDRWCLYGGPFLHFINGEFDGTVGGIDISGDFEEDSIFGGFVGARIGLTTNTELGIEYQQTGSAHAFGASILFRF